MFRGMTAMIYKEFQQVRKDPATLVLALMIPLIQLTIFGYAIDTQVRDIPTAVLDRSNTKASRYVVEALRNTDVFDPVRHLTRIQDLQKLMRSGEVSVGVVIPDDFDGRLSRGDSAMIQVLIDGSDSNMAQQAMSAALHTGDWLGALLTARFHEEQNAAGPSLEVRPRLLYNPNQESAYFFIPGLVGIILQLVTMMLTAFSIVRERERNTLEQLLVTPVSRVALLLGKLLPFLLIGSAEAVTVLCAMVFIFGVKIQGSLVILGFMVVLFLFCSLSLGLFISTVAHTQLQAMLIAIMILLPSVLLSGFVFPRRSMPAPIYAFTFLIPSTYFIEIMRGIVLRGAGFMDLVRFALPLLGLGAGLFSLGVLRFHKRLS